jgi:hypothetical protein
VRDRGGIRDDAPDGYCGRVAHGPADPVQALGRELGLNTHDVSDPHWFVLC